MKNSDIPAEHQAHDLLGGLSPREFLQHYWQKRPLFIPGALRNFSSPLSPDELAGLACEPEVESRLVLEFAGSQKWALEHGPFAETRFAELPENHWSLLVQECNKYSPELAELMQRFGFIPHWRIDDIMASFSPTQGSVGPHVDQYDVFLIQAMGTRRWQISTQAVAEDNFLTDTELRIMRDFHAEQEWLVQPGDILYLPPGVAHYGVAQEDCITLSVGFRAPSHSEIISGFLEHAADNVDSNLRYADPELELQQHPGEIMPGALDKIRQLIREAVADDQAIAQWFGEYVTEAKSPLAPEIEDDAYYMELEPEAFLETFKQGGCLERNITSRFAFIRDEDETSLFVDGETFPLPPESTRGVAILCDKLSYNYIELSAALDNPEFLDTVCELYNRGVFTLTENKLDIQHVSWEEAERPLRAIRTAVFIVEQNVPPELEWEDADKTAIHLLARNAEGRPVGTARLLPDGHIGRLAVLKEYRGKGIGSALLKMAIRIAKQQGVSNIALNAQLHALGFYEQLGFVARGEEFMEAGIPHRHMLYEPSLGTAEDTIDNSVEEDDDSELDFELDLALLTLGKSTETVMLNSRQQQRQIARHMLQQASRSLRLFTYNLDASLYDNEAFVDTLKQLAIAHPNTKIYILIQEPKDVVLHGHRVVELFRRLNSHIFINRADAEDLKRIDNFMLVDDAGFIRRPHANRYEGTACFNNPAEVRKYQKFFEEAWERSQPEPELRRLHI